MTFKYAQFGMINDRSCTKIMLKEYPHIHAFEMSHHIYLDDFNP